MLHDLPANYFWAAFLGGLLGFFFGDALNTLFCRLLGPLLDCKKKGEGE